MKDPGDDLLSHTVSHAVSSALEGLTSVFGMGTGVAPPLRSPESRPIFPPPGPPCRFPDLEVQPKEQSGVPGTSPWDLPEWQSLGQASRPISTGKLHPLPDFHTLPINLVVSEGSSVPITRKGDLILKRASRLDAFSAYLNRTWLPSGAPGGTTGTPSVRPTRSSRTEVSPSQISYAHSR